MSNKTARLLAIKKIIKGNNVCSQEELLSELQKKGFAHTQATLSRDLRFLRASKVPDEKKGYVYKISDSNIETQRVDDSVSSGFKSIEFSNNLAVIKTMPGYASSVAFKIDNSNSFEIIGTIAGDDTLLVIPRDNVSKSDLMNVLALIVPELNKK